MQLYNPLTIVPSSGPLSLWPSHSFWDPNLIKKCPPVPTILLVARQTPRLAASFLFLESASRTLALSSPSHPSIFLYSP